MDQQQLLDAIRQKIGSIGNKKGGATQPPPFQSNAQAPGAFQAQDPNARRALVQAMVARSRAGGTPPATPGA